MAKTKQKYESKEHTREESINLDYFPANNLEVLELGLKLTNLNIEDHRIVFGVKLGKKGEPEQVLFVESYIETSWKETSKRLIGDKVEKLLSKNSSPYCKDALFTLNGMVDGLEELQMNLDEEDDEEFDEDKD